MEFEWDERKAATNLVKHGVDFDVAIRVFGDPFRVTILSTARDYGEVRELTIGMVDGVEILTVVHTDRNGITRIISARPASHSEREKYHGK